MAEPKNGTVLELGSEVITAESLRRSASRPGAGSTALISRQDMQ